MSGRATDAVDERRRPEVGWAAVSRRLDREAFARRVARLGPDGFRDLVAALHADRPDVVVVGPDGPVDGDAPAPGVRRLHAHHPRDGAAPSTADGLVSPIPGGPGAGPDYLFALACHGAGPAGAAACRSALGAAPVERGALGADAPAGVAPAGPWRAGDDPPRASRWRRLRARVAAALVPTRLPGRAGRGAALAAVLVVAVSLVAGAALTGATGLGRPADAAGGTGTLAPRTAAATTPTPTGTASPTEPGTGRAAGGTGSIPERYASLRPTCERPPGLVVRLQVGALRTNPAGSDAGIRTVFAFGSPATQRATGPVDRFARLIRNDRYAPLLNHTRTRYGPTEVVDGEARQPVTVVGPDGVEHGYEWILSLQDGPQYEGCWMTDAVVLVSDGDETTADGPTPTPTPAATPDGGENGTATATATPTPSDGNAGA